MERHFEKELEKLKGKINLLFSLVTKSLESSIEAVMKNSEPHAKAVYEYEHSINSLELEIDNGVVDLLALRQPVASDLRLILAILKINNDLERIGDHAVNIAESAQGLIETPEQEPLLKVPQMADHAMAMLRDANQSFNELNALLAQKVLERDDIIDTMNRELLAEVAQLIKEDQSTIEGNLQLARISRNLERVADLTTNIAEEVIFYLQARVVKHHAEEGNQK
ncbi:MAG: phosphate signaling complex protein PhoU [Bacteroidota bacterium]|jgi:phosphate transport system protein